MTYSYALCLLHVLHCNYNGLRQVTNMVMESKTAMLNFLLLILLALPILLLELIGSPTERGFFFDDDSLSYPYKIDTVPNWLLYMMGFGIPMVLILIGDLSIMRSSSRENTFQSLKHSYTMIILYLLGKCLSSNTIKIYLNSAPSPPRM